ncbi:hypothetical protein WJU16_24965 [Chitinophaga pollutisoli]|uniref:Tryptophan-rich sensory protein n=1 Tax=Chitinophaga pollutisoli TaxID=3133966 RepID=A0ABZ2YNB3_9BACT
MSSNETRMETRMSIPHFRQQAFFNLIALLVVIGVNIMANTATLNGHTTGEVSDMYPNLFTPAGITFSIWSVIYLGLLAFAGYQLWIAFAPGREGELTSLMVRMGPWFLLNCLGNACWLFAWHYELIGISLLLMIFILYTLVRIHARFRIADPKAPLAEKTFLFFPFGVYFGWITIALFANLTIWGLAMGWNVYGVGGVYWTLLCMILGTLAALLMVFRFNNIWYGLTGIWAYYGIILKRDAVASPDSPPIVAAGTIIMAVLALSILMQLLRKRPLV